MASNSSRNAFLIHLAAYAGVIAILVTLNAMQVPEQGAAKSWWSLYAAAGWGIGVVAHGLAYWLERRAVENSLLADEDARAVAIHLFVYLAVNALLIVVNVRTSPDTMWSIWPILGWGAGLGAHAWLAYRKVLKKTVERYATEQQVLTQMQLERQAAEIAAAIEQKPEDAKPAKRRKASARKPAKAAATRKTGSTKRAKKPATKKPAAKKPASKGRKRAASSRAKS